MKLSECEPELKFPKCIVGIDPGKSGGVAFISSGGLEVHDMPETFEDLRDLLIGFKKRFGHVVGVLENVHTYRTDRLKAGMEFAIEKMIRNSETCKNALNSAGITYVQVEPRKWQGDLRLSKKGETKTQRKNRAKDYAKSMYPTVKINLPVADSVCIAIYGFKTLKNYLEKNK